MGLNDTPGSERKHIAFFGCRNAGKSSLLNAVTGQKFAIVSNVPGTTTDPVYKAMELLPMGPVMIIDTPGYDDEDSWIGNKYNYTDDRAVDETYAMMREPEHSVANKTYLLGSTNDVLGSALLWGPIGSMTPAEAVESATPVWQDMLDVFNGDKTQEQVDAEHAAAEAAAAEAAAAEEVTEAAGN